MVDYNSEVRKLIGGHKFFLFSASWCPDCRYAISVFSKYGVIGKIHNFDIASLSTKEQQEWRNAFQKVTGSRNLPTLYVNGSVWVTEAQLHKFESRDSLAEEFAKIGLTS